MTHPGQAPERSSTVTGELSPEELSIINDMTHAWLDDPARYRIAFRNDCKRLVLASHSRHTKLMPIRAPGNDQLSGLWNAIVENTKGDGFWIGEILLSVLEREVGFNPAALRLQIRNTVADSTGEKTGTHGASKEAGGHSRDGLTPVSSLSTESKSPPTECRSGE
jgi:hypothetical protein